MVPESAGVAREELSFVAVSPCGLQGKARNTYLLSLFTTVDIAVRFATIVIFLHRKRYILFMHDGLRRRVEYQTCEEAGSWVL